MSGEEEEALTVIRDDSRVSDLPDGILLHILSFLDTKSSVRTGALSSRWTNLWKEVNVIDVRASFFRRNNKSSLQNLLSTHGSHHNVVGHVGFHFGHRQDPARQDLDDELFDMVMGYAAASLGIAHRDRHRHRSTVLSVASDVRFSRIAESFTRLGHHEHVTTLKLEGSYLDPPSSIADLGFTKLTTLELRRCRIGRRGSDDHDDDAFAGFPCLSNLKLIHCWYWKPVSVSGLELRNLEIKCDSFGANSRICDRVFAPKLRSLYLSVHAYDIWSLDEVSLASIDHASVRLDWTNLVNKSGYVDVAASRAIATLLRGLRNAKSLNLCFEDKSREQCKGSVVARMKPLIEDELSCFTKLKTLKVQYPEYIVEGSLHMLQKSLSSLSLNQN